MNLTKVLILKKLVNIEYAGEIPTNDEILGALQDRIAHNPLILFDGAQWQLEDVVEMPDKES